MACDTPISVVVHFEGFSPGVEEELVKPLPGRGNTTSPTVAFGVMGPRWSLGNRPQHPESTGGLFVLFDVGVLYCI